MTTTRATLAEVLKGNLGFGKSESQGIVDACFEAIILALESGEVVKLSGFGNFTVRQKRSRPGRNPKTREEVIISPRRVVIFKPSNHLRRHPALASGGLRAPTVNRGDIGPVTCTPASGESLD